MACAGKREDCEPNLATGLCTRPLSLPEPSSLTPVSLDSIVLGDLYSCVSRASEIYLCKFANIDEAKWSQHTGRGQPNKIVFKQLVKSRPLGSTSSQLQCVFWSQLSSHLISARRWLANDKAVPEYIVKLIAAFAT